MVILGLSQALTYWRPGNSSAAAAAPAEFASGEWGLSDPSTGGVLVISVLGLPENGGAPISTIEYDLDASGIWIDTGLSAPGSVSVTGLIDGQTYSVRLRAQNAVGAGAASLPRSAQPSLDSLAPTIGAISINQSSDEIELTGVSEAGTFFALVDGMSAPMAGADIEAAVAAQTAAAFVSLPLSSGTNAVVMDKSGVGAGPVYLHSTVRDLAGNYSADMPLAFTQPADVAPPVLSAPIGAANGATAANGSVDTDEGNGTLYAVLSANAAVPAADQIKAGRDQSGAPAVWAGAQPVLATGSQPLSPAPSGLAPSTSYFIHYMHEDAAGNGSGVVTSAGFTTGASGAGASLVTSTTAKVTNAPDISIGVPANQAGDHIYYFVVAPQTLPVATPAGLTLVATVAGYGTTGTSCQMFQRISAGAEPATQVFSGGWSNRLAHALSVRNSSGVVAASAGNSGWGTMLNAPSISLSGGSMVVDLFLSATAISRTGTLQNDIVGATACALGVRENLPAGPSGAQTASLAADNAWAAVQIEILG